MAHGRLRHRIRRRWHDMRSWTRNTIYYERHRIHRWRSRHHILRRGI